MSQFQPGFSELALPSTWFEKRITLEQIRKSFARGKREIRIACGFFTVKGWGLIRRYTEDKRVFLLIGIDDEAEEKAKALVINEILSHLERGIDSERRSSVEALVKRLESGNLYIVDARATDHHGKIYIVDDCIAINASANTTGKGFLDQVESGGLYAPWEVDEFIARYESKEQKPISTELVSLLHQFVQEQVAGLLKHFDEYFDNAHDISGQLLAALKAWLVFNSPWDVYLKTLLALVEDFELVETTYRKQPTDYQRDMIAENLRQLKRHSGSMLVASTGLGKTVMGIWIALQLKNEGLIDRVAIIAPKAVHSSWNAELRHASLQNDIFTLAVLDKADSSYAHQLDTWLDIQRDIENGVRYLLILDESQEIRNRYPDEHRNLYANVDRRRERRAFSRLKTFVHESGHHERVKVLLLSGSPYAKDIEDLNNQLYLLPHHDDETALFPDFLPKKAWRVDALDNNLSAYLNLPVVHQLTTPFVSRHYGQEDEQGRFIFMNGSKRYFPSLTLHSQDFPLQFEEMLSPLLLDGVFNLNSRNPIHRTNFATHVKTTWASSPLVLRELLEQIADTPNGLKSLSFAERGKTSFVLSQEERREKLNPLIALLLSLSYDEDLKLTQLLQVLDTYAPQEKVIVFVERYATAYYLEKALQSLRPHLNTYSTVAKLTKSKSEVDTYNLRDRKKIEKAIKRLAPISNDYHPKHGEELDVFISTDAFGVGVNLQDASIAVNYDMAWTPIEPTQRLGRILRLWHEPRELQLFTLIPTLEMYSSLRSDLNERVKRWESLMDRHELSRQIVDLPVLSHLSSQNIELEQYAQRQFEQRTSRLELNQDDSDFVSPYFHHTRNLLSHRDYAQTLDREITSALLYKGKEKVLFMLVEVEGEDFLLLYTLQNRKFKEPQTEELLNLIACTPDTHIAMANGSEIEEASYDCLEQWCQSKEIDPETVRRQANLLLIPEHEQQSIPVVK